MSLILFAVLAGAVQMVAPDRWLPASVFAWQRGWRVLALAGLSLLGFTVHIALGYGIYLVLAAPLNRVPESSMGVFCLVFLGAVGAVRALRFSRFKEVLYRGPKAGSLILTLLSLIGPSEMVIPVLMKAQLDHVALLPILASLWVGTCLCGFLVLLVARARWNRPMALPSAVEWCQSRVAAFPMAAGAFIGVILIAFGN